MYAAMLREALLRENSDYDQVEHVLGSKVALRLARFGNGGRYISVGEWGQLKAWLVDFVVVLAGVGVGALVLAVANRTADLDKSTMVVLIILMFPVASFFYGAWYGDGRALGAALTGIQLVRAADGGRIGGNGPWVMMVRIVLAPLGAVIQLGGALAGHAGPHSITLSSRRVSLDVEATRRLRAAGII